MSLSVLSTLATQTMVRGLGEPTHPLKPVRNEDSVYKIAIETYHREIQLSKYFLKQIGHSIINKLLYEPIN